MCSAPRYALRLVVLTVVLAAGCSGCVRYQLYWGDVHVHTNISDGKGDLDDVLTYGRDVARLDFVVITDHDFGNAPPWRMPKEMWERTQEKVDAYTAPARFVAIAGYEWTSQPKYWTDVEANVVSERLFPGPPKFYNHKNVYFPSRVDCLFSAKDPAYNSPDLLARAVLKAGGLIHNGHPSSNPEEKDQFDYDRAYDSVIVNTEIEADAVCSGGKTYTLDSERVVCDFLNKGGKTGFVKGTDTHEGKPAARTAVLATELTREGIFDALRHRRNYAVSNARIVLDFQVNGHDMGEEIAIEGKPRIVVNVNGTDKIAEAAIIRNGSVLHCVRPGKKRVEFTYVDDSFRGNAYYYLRVIQADTDEYGNRSYAWSSPIWVKKKP